MSAGLLTVEVPDIGDFEDVPIIEILVAPGDTVAVEDPLVTLESDKATMDVPAPAAGVVKEITAKVGDKVSQGAALMTLEGGDGGGGGAPDADEAAPVEEPAPVAEAAPVEEPAPSEEPGRQRRWPDLCQPLGAAARPRARGRAQPRERQRAQGPDHPRGRRGRRPRPRSGERRRDCCPGHRATAVAISRL